MTLNWKIDEGKGTLRFGSGPVPRTGNTYTIDVSGGRAGVAYSFSVVSDDAREILARSETSGGTTTISFNLDTLRKEFRGGWHEVRTFHTVACDGTNVVAEGDLAIELIPVWTDAELGQVVSMKGPQGVGIQANESDGYDADGNAKYKLRLTNGQYLSWTAPKGPTGEMASASYVKNETTGKYHKLVVYTNDIGELLVDLDPNGTDSPPTSGHVVTLADAQTITGAKTFSAAITASSGLVGNVTGIVTGNVTGNVTGDVTGNVTGDVTGSVDASGSGCSSLVKTKTESTNDTNAASTQFVHTVAHGLVVVKRINFNGSYAVSLSGFGYAEKTFDVDLTGYTPVLAVGTTSIARVCVTKCSFSKKNDTENTWSFSCYLWNASNSNASSVTLSVDILFVKNMDVVETTTKSYDGAQMQGVTPPGGDGFTVSNIVSTSEE